MQEYHAATHRKHGGTLVVEERVVNINIVTGRNNFNGFRAYYR